MGSLALQDIKGVMRIVFRRSLRCSRALEAMMPDGAPKPQEQGMKAALKAQAAHDVVHDKGHAGHVPAVLQYGQRQEQDEDVGQEGQDAAHAGDDAVHDGEVTMGPVPTAARPSDTRPEKASRPISK